MDVRKRILAGLFAIAGYTVVQTAINTYTQNALDLVQHKLEKKEAKRKIAHDYDTSPLMSQAVFILPPPYASDSVNKTYGYGIRDELQKHGIPAFIIGDTAGNATVLSIQRMIWDIQAKNHFQAVTVLSLTHGGVYDLNGRGYDSLTAIKQWDAWSKYPEKTQHGTAINRGPVEITATLMKAMVDAADVKKMDWFSLLCFSGAIDQKTVNILPPHSTFVALSGGGEISYFDAQIDMLKTMRQGKMDFDEGVNATALMVEALQENWREYSADVVIGVSGGEEIAILPNTTHDNHCFSSAAASSSAQQMERAKRSKFRKHIPRP